MRILNSCIVEQVSNVNPGCPASQPHTCSARLLFDETFVQPDVSALVSYPILALSVFYSPVVTRCRIFCSYELFCLRVECCVLFRSPNLER